MERVKVEEQIQMRECSGDGDLSGAKSRGAKQRSEKLKPKLDMKNFLEVTKGGDIIMGIENKKELKVNLCELSLFLCRSHIKWTC